MAKSCVWSQGLSPQDMGRLANHTATAYMITLASSVFVLPSSIGRDLFNEQRLQCYPYLFGPRSRVDGMPTDEIFVNAQDVYLPIDKVGDKDPLNEFPSIIIMYACRAGRAISLHPPNSFVYGQKLLS
jgi:hypothetical protein